MADRPLEESARRRRPASSPSGAPTIATATAISASMLLALLPEGSLVAVARARDRKTELTRPIRASRTLSLGAAHATGDVAICSDRQHRRTRPARLAPPRRLAGDVFPLRRELSTESWQYRLDIRALSVRPGRRRRRARDRRRPGACRHHRARAFPLLGRRRKGAAPRRAPGLHPQGHREALRRTAAGEGHRLAARVSGDSAVAFSWAYCAALEAITQTALPAARITCARSRSSTSGSPTTWATSARSATMPASPSASRSSRA